MEARKFFISLETGNYDPDKVGKASIKIWKNQLWLNFPIIECYQIDYDVIDSFMAKKW